MSNPHPYRPQESHYFDAVNQTLNLTATERTLLEKNGFLLSDRLQFPQFKRGYAYIYWKDWPVLVTTDSILHAVHQTYDHIFQQVESDILQPKLSSFLAAVYQQLEEVESLSEDPRIAAVTTDLKTYLSVPLLVLGAMRAADATKAAKDASDAIRMVNDPNVADDNIPLANDISGLKMMRLERWYELDPLNKPQTLRLFGMDRYLEFGAFKARGHYIEGRLLPRYFGAMMWLALLDFRFVSYDDSGQPQLRIEQIAAARLLHEAIGASGQRPVWDEIDRLLTAFIGWSDNITLNGLDRFWQEAGISSVGDCFAVQPEHLLHLLTTHDYGQQRIAAQGLTNSPLPEGVLSNPISFMLMGQRFTVESLIMNEVIFDRLMVNGEKVPRAYPNPLDVLYALGNDRAAEHLQPEFARYQHRETLDQLREVMSTYSHEFWESSFYNLWLKMILTLNQRPTGEHLPTAMKADTWSDKMLHTQLSGWAQLRHDHILYVKPPQPIYCVCDYPTGYVEPYPAFYAAVADFARYGRKVFADLKIDADKATELDFLRTVQDHFELLEDTAEQLKSLANKELKGEPFTQDEALFVKSVVVRKFVGVEGYGGYVEEAWDGWYNDLLPFGDKRAAVVTDLHINMEPALGPTGVLHVGTGDPAVMLLLVGEGEEQTMYVGPAFTYYEHLEPGINRLSDWEWEALFRSPLTNELAAGRLEKLKQDLKTVTNEQRAVSLKKLIDERQAQLDALRPSPPSWTASFRVSNPAQTSLELPNSGRDISETVW